MLIKFFKKYAWFISFAVFLIFMFIVPTRVHHSGKDLSNIKLSSVFKNQPNLEFSKMKGKKYIISVFASWCQSCLVEHQFWFTINDKIDVYGIDHLDVPEKAVKWLKKYGNPYKSVGSDTVGILGKFLKVTGIPETILVDENGQILAHFNQIMTKEVWERSVKPLL